MPLPEHTYKNVNTTRNPTIATMEQFLRGGESSKMSPTYSPTSPPPSSPYFERLKHQDLEDDQGLYQKKSVLTKVKERARRFRYSLSKKKQEDGNLTPSWGVSLEDEEEEEDAEYLGAPIYESELAPEEYKENARQHPRANPVISEKRILLNTTKSGVEQNQDKTVSTVQSTTTTQPATTTTPPGPNKTMTETLAEKLTPAYLAAKLTPTSLAEKLTPSSLTEGSDAANSTPSKTQAVSRTPANMSSQTSSVAPSASSVPSPIQNSSSSSVPLSGKNTSPNSASMKDYVVNKFEPGNDEKTPSKVMTYESVSPRKTQSNNTGVMERVKGAVNSLLQNDEPSLQYAVKTPTTHASSQITKTQEVGQEENHGRILQAN